MRVKALDTDIGYYRAQLLASLHFAWECATEEYKKEVEKYKDEYDKRVKDPKIMVGDRVMLRDKTTRKGLSPKFHLPWNKVFRVIKIEQPHAFIVSCASPQEAPRKVHLNQIKKYLEPLGPTITRPKLDDDQIVELEKVGAEKILNMPGYDHEIKDEHKLNRKPIKPEKPVFVQTRYNLRRK